MPTKAEIDAAVEEKAARDKRAADLTAKRADERAKRENETKGDAFIRIGNRRVNSALDELAKIETIFNPANYEFTPAQAEKIIGILDVAVGKIKKAAGGEKAGKTGFEI